MNMLTFSSEKIFNPMHYISDDIDYVAFKMFQSLIICYVPIIDVIQNMLLHNILSYDD